MTIIKRLEIFQRELENEFKNDAIKVIMLYDADIRLLSVGVNHPLYSSYLCDMRELPRVEVDECLGELYDQFRHDLTVINERIKEQYE
jgi:hypothetical protein